MKIKLLFMAMVLQIVVFAQSGKIIAVSGMPKRAESKQLLQQGDKITEKESILWYSKKDTLVINVLGRGLGFFTPSNDPRLSAGKQSEWQSLLRDMVWLKKSNGLLAGRNVRFNSTQELNHYFSQYGSDSNSLLIIDSMAFSISTEFYSQLGNGFLYGQYIDENDTINKKISLRKDENQVSATFILDTSLQRVDAVPRGLVHRKKIVIYYYSETAGSSVFLTEFYLTVIPAVTVQSVLNVLACDQEHLESTALAYLTWLYGVPEKKELKKIIKHLHCN